jgi:hypothetical protein
MKCKFCGEDLPKKTHGKRRYCDDAHKQAYYRQKVQAQQDQQQKDLEKQPELEAEITRLKRRVSRQAREIEQLERTITLLKQQLNLEHRYLADSQARGFVAFLRRQPPTPLIERLLHDRYVVELLTQVSRWTVEWYLRNSMKLSDEEMGQFKDLWKLLMLETTDES